MSLEIRFDARPEPARLAALRESVGWPGRPENWPRAYDAYACTASAWEDGELVGWVSLLSDGVHHAFLADVLVHPDHQRRGIGRRLVRGAVERLAARGVTLFHVDFAEPNAAFYRACGFRLGRGGYLEIDHS